MKWTVGKGIDEYIAQLQRLEGYSDRVVGRSIYEGAKIVADEVRKGIDSLPIREEYIKDQATRGVTKTQKKGLQDGFGISTKKTDGTFVNVKLGFDGYNDTHTKKYPKGQPNAMVARFVESGNSYHIKTPFIGPAVNRSKSRAEDKMKLVVDQEIQAIMK